MGKFSYILSLCGIIFIVQQVYAVAGENQEHGNPVTSFSKIAEDGTAMNFEIDGNTVIANTLGVKTKYRDIDIHDSNGFRVESYYQSFLKGALLKVEDLNRETLIATLSHPTIGNVAVGHNALGSNDNGIELRQRDKKDTYLFVVDYDGDGIMDHLSYTVLDSSGSPVKIVDDYGMDGQADYKHDIKTGETSVFYQGKWHTTKRDEQDLIIGGKPISINSILREIKKNNRK